MSFSLLLVSPNLTSSTGWPIHSELPPTLGIDLVQTGGSTPHTAKPPEVLAEVTDFPNTTA